MAIWPGWVSFVKQAADAVVGLVVQRSSASSTADLQEWQDDAGNTMLAVSSSGQLAFTSGANSATMQYGTGAFSENAVVVNNILYSTNSIFEMAQAGGQIVFRIRGGDASSRYQCYNVATGVAVFNAYQDRLEIAAVRPGANNPYNSLSDVKFAGRQTSAGTPTANTWVANDLFIDSKGVWQLCTTGGTPGTWAAGGWQLAGFWKAGSALQTSGAITVAAFDELMIAIRIVSLSASDTLSLRFNGDTGANYSAKIITAPSGTAVLTNVSSLTSLTMARITGNSASTARTITVVISNRSGTSKVGSITSALGSGSAASASAADVFAQCEWVNTAAQITSVTLLTTGGSATMAADSGFLVFGRDFA